MIATALLLTPLCVGAQGLIPVGREAHTPEVREAPQKARAALGIQRPIFRPEFMGPTPPEDIAMRNDPNIDTAMVALRANVMRIIQHAEAARLYMALKNKMIKEVTAELKKKGEGVEPRAMMQAMADYFGLSVPYTPLPADIDPWVVDKEKSLALIKAMMTQKLIGREVELPE